MFFGMVNSEILTVNIPGTNFICALVTYYPREALFGLISRVDFGQKTSVQDVLDIASKCALTASYTRSASIASCHHIDDIIWVIRRH